MDLRSVSHQWRSLNHQYISTKHPHLRRLMTRYKYFNYYREASERRKFGSIKFYRRGKSAVGAKLFHEEISIILQSFIKPTTENNPAICVSQFNGGSTSNFHGFSVEPRKASLRLTISGKPQAILR